MRVERRAVVKQFGRQIDTIAIHSSYRRMVRMTRSIVRPEGANYQ
jgi:hypothetical protein